MAKLPLVEAAAICSGDWSCPACNDVQFARNLTCRRCGTGKPTHTGLTASLRPVTRDPTAEKSAFAPLSQMPNAADWTCPMCDEQVFGNKNQCRRCGTCKPVGMQDGAGIVVASTCWDGIYTGVVGHGKELKSAWGQQWPELAESPGPWAFTGLLSTAPIARLPPGVKPAVNSDHQSNSSSSSESTSSSSDVEQSSPKANSSEQPIGKSARTHVRSRSRQSGKQHSGSGPSALDHVGDKVRIKAGLPVLHGQTLTNATSHLDLGFVCEPKRGQEQGSTKFKSNDAKKRRVPKTRESTVEEEVEKRRLQRERRASFKAAQAISLD